MNQSVSSQSSVPSWNSDEAPYAAASKEKSYLLVALAITSIVVGLLGVLAVQGVNLGPINSFSKLTIWGSGAFIVAGIALLIVKAATKKLEPSVTYEKNSETINVRGKLSFNNELTLGLNDVLSVWRIYVLFSEHEENLASEIIQQAIRKAQFPIWSDFDLDLSRVTIKIRQSDQKSDILKRFLSPLAVKLKQNNITVPIPTNLTRIKTAKLPQYFYYGLEFESCETSNPTNLPKFLEDIQITGEISRT